MAEEQKNEKVKEKEKSMQNDKTGEDNETVAEKGKSIQEDDTVEEKDRFKQHFPHVSDSPDDIDSDRRIMVTKLVHQPEVTSKIKYKDFKGIFAPVFTCFRNDERNSLDVRYVNRYAECLHAEKIVGVFVNSVMGEGTNMSAKERRANLEYWHRACIRHDMLVLVQVGGAPLPDVLSLADHAETLGVSGVLTLPELFFRPLNVDHLIKYCQKVASHCKTRPFFYYHMPALTGVDFDMDEFCTKAEQSIPNFLGIHYSSGDLEIGQKCLRKGRVIFLGSSSIITGGLMSGFTSICVAVANVRPDLVLSIWDAFKQNDFHLTREKQLEINRLIKIHTHSADAMGWQRSMKEWFNKIWSARRSGGFTMGPSRTLY